MEDYQRYKLGYFREALTRLTWPAERQQAWLREIGIPHAADELAMEFDDFYADLGRSIGHGEAAPVLAELDGLLDRMSGEVNAHLWDAEALVTEPDWQRVRELATAALGVLPGHDR
ncbi:hypothetical protein [Amycolatopsis sp. SID8362]|uniref:hypothetical protein n=1 Tax=Amycolatopsis sp. SID8362 TaxID=2690346 RepID=UPI00136A3520|nr:hypothetical protein [Amycolatopsis sp. SID8362]NBH03777.1 hypothetical protein [Amycolatopsis sp. SID8362]NED40477.1 hypothetical protein [Amycolatopsis sp. SID8362]